MNMQRIWRGVAHLALIGVLGLLLGGAAIAQDAVAGKKAFAQCSVCHSTDGTNGVGPTLQGIVGSKAGEVPGFRFSRAMKASNIMWDDKSLDAYLADPQKTIPGNVMPFSGLADAKERADLIAYLKTLK
jgi:cytochrome c